METTIEIGGDTIIWTTDSQHCGCGWMDGILGNQSSEIYAGANVDDELPAFCDWLSVIVRSGNGYWLSEEDARDEGELISMTPRQMLIELIRTGNENKQYNES